MALREALSWLGGTRAQSVWGTRPGMAAASMTYVGV